jgi:hypothetical protein
LWRPIRPTILAAWRCSGRSSEARSRFCGNNGKSSFGSSPGRHMGTHSRLGTETSTCETRKTTSSGVWTNETCFWQSSSESKLPTGTTIAGGQIRQDSRLRRLKAAAAHGNLSKVLALSKIAALTSISGRAKNNRFKNSCRRSISGARKRQRLYWRALPHCQMTEIPTGPGNALDLDVG